MTPVEKVPVVAHKRNRADWFITMQASDWFKLLARSDRVRDNGDPARG